MTLTTTGWTIFLAAIGMMFSLLAVDIAAIKDWNQIVTPTFVGTTIGHIAAVIAAFVGGKLIPTDRDPDMRTRQDDKVSEAKVIQLNKDN